MSEKKGIKNDSLKLRVEIPEPLPQEFFYGAFTYGAIKYNESSKTRNYKQVADPDIRYLAANRRHGLSYQRGELFDAESGLPHSVLMMFNAFCLLSYDIDTFKLTRNDLDILMNIWRHIIFTDGKLDKVSKQKIQSQIRKFSKRKV